MNIYTDLLLVSAIVIYIVDLSGFTQTWKDALGKLLGGKVGRLRPLDCSLCMVWWSGLIYAYIVGELSLQITAYVAGLSLMSVPIGQLLMLVRELINKIINLIMQRL